MRLLLVRHGESTGNLTRVMQPRDEPLTERGRRQARAIAAFLAARGDVGAIYTSPLNRARETSEIIGAVVGLAPQPLDGLAEIDVGSAAGMTFDDWAARFPDEASRFGSAGIDYAFPGGESGRQLGERTAQAIDTITADHKADERAVVVVSHGGALAWILGYLLGEPRDSWPRHQFDNCSLTEVTVDPSDERRVTVVCQNQIGHLPPEPEEEVATGRA